MIVCNAFSLSMLPPTASTLRVEPCTLLEARELVRNLPYRSAVGHVDTACLFSTLLGVEIPPNRVNVGLTLGGEPILVGQYVGPRLPEGAKELPPGAEIRWFHVSLQ